MLLNEPIFYYEAILARFKNSYLAQDSTQAIIGIDCDYVSAAGAEFDGEKFAKNAKFGRTDFAGLKSYFAEHKNASGAPFAGLFGVFGFESVKYFEDVKSAGERQYDFANFIYANARAYLHFDKISKIYGFYGDAAKYYDFLEALDNVEPSKPKTRAKFKILTDLDAEKSHFESIVEKAKDYIKAGDVFQVVLSEQLALVSDLSSLKFYEILSAANPSPYMFHFPTPFGDVVGSSPELVFELKGEQIFVAPIAGTRPRGKDANEDATLQMQLLSDEKELAEHKMLIDLARNDIGHVAKTRSVVVKNALNIVKYESVMHIISDVYGQREQGVSAFDVAASVFPAGTLSGTPKIRAMQIIGELETFKRNAYGGGIGFLHFNGDAQMAILIRSAVFTPFKLGEDEIQARNLGADASGEISKIFVQAGAGIVFDSDPQREYAEICHKRASVLNVFKNNCEEIK